MSRPFSKRTDDDDVRQTGTERWRQTVCRQHYRPGTRLGPAGVGRVRAEKLQGLLAALGTDQRDKAEGPEGVAEQSHRRVLRARFVYDRHVSKVVCRRLQTGIYIKMLIVLYRCLIFVSVRRSS